MRDGDSADTKSSGSGAGLRRLARVIPGRGGQNDLVQTNLEPMAGGKGVWIGGQVRVMTLGAAVAAFGPGFVSRFDGMDWVSRQHARRNSGQVNLTSGGQAVKEHITFARETMRAMPEPEHRRYLARAAGSQLSQFQAVTGGRRSATAAEVSHLDRVWDLVSAWDAANDRDRAVLIAFLSGFSLPEIGAVLLNRSRQAANKAVDRACNHLAWDYVGRGFS